MASKTQPKPRPHRINKRRVLQGDSRLIRIERLLMWDKQKFRCHYCGEEMTVDKSLCNTDLYATFDHVVATVNARRHKSTNRKQVLACRKCNVMKGDSNAKKFKKRMIALIQGGLHYGDPASSN